MKKNNKGFTLAELLIVVAIIAVLVAIAIPIFTTQLEKSREATDVANTRSAYAEVVAAALTEAKDVSATIDLKQQEDDWQGANPTSELAQLGATYSGFSGAPAVAISGTPHKGGTAVIAYTAPSGATPAAISITFS